METEKQQLKKAEDARKKTDRDLSEKEKKHLRFKQEIIKLRSERGREIEEKVTLKRKLSDLTSDLKVATEQLEVSELMLKKTERRLHHVEGDISVRGLLGWGKLAGDNVKGVLKGKPPSFYAIIIDGNGNGTLIKRTETKSTTFRHKDFEYDKMPGAALGFDKGPVMTGSSMSIYRYRNRKPLRVEIPKVEREKESGEKNIFSPLNPARLLYIALETETYHKALRGYNKANNPALFIFLAVGIMVLVLLISFIWGGGETVIIAAETIETGVNAVNESSTQQLLNSVPDAPSG